ncbi:hypothetical protein COT68_03225 [bacterium (Candidatus Torokbacteria) CG09_land_8_20_14_0_10_42_11]|nr:MAG: hypothetical protein COT68_03225 [bacterium (Candidatus Torokbacteria) CG09_land_8_20_14_0_10_42_11]
MEKEFVYALILLIIFVLLAIRLKKIIKKRRVKWLTGCSILLIKIGIFFKKIGRDLSDNS